MFAELTRLLDDLAGKELTHALRMRRSAHLLELCSGNTTQLARTLADFAESALRRGMDLRRCIKRLGHGATGGNAHPHPQALEHLDTDTILSNELIEALGAADAFHEVARYTDALDLSTQKALTAMHAEREHELCILARMLDMYRAAPALAA